MISIFILSVVLSCAAAGGSGDYHDEICPRFCTKEYVPVCASNGIENRTFSTKCMLKFHNCHNLDKYHELYDGECLNNKCPNICTMDYKPVCAFDGRKYQTFSNLCTFHSVQCKNPKIAGEPSFDSCPIGCNKLYSPVCGYNGNTYRTFSNTCLLKFYNCQTHDFYSLKSDFVIVHTIFSMNRVGFLVIFAFIACVTAGGPSKVCPQFCTLEYFPICATNGTDKITFGNKCQFISYNCLHNDSFYILKYGECDKPECPDVCTFIYLPVCGFNGENYKTFANDCERLSENCHAPFSPNYDIVSQGECPS
ncbi:hypothetical protein PVAND_013919 [Polypedilum vanderplanki]|uniref:Kazal-like domain-containing protein n=1 Tax=Polypedilum vanderplanki TaxID=319348 RepID=A0A9J6CR64_POLVA|nr:hypothetical protein PVAND_013919 [Polypedilum vanderplanki]